MDLIVRSAPRLKSTLTYFYAVKHLYLSFRLAALGSAKPNRLRTVPVVEVCARPPQAMQMALASQPNVQNEKSP